MKRHAVRRLALTVAFCCLAAAAWQASTAQAQASEAHCTHGDQPGSHIHDQGVAKADVLFTDPQVQWATAADEKRARLWQALEKALPKKYQRIDAYAENTSLTVVLFHSPGSVSALRFSLKTGKVEEVPHMKALKRINRITFVGGTDVSEWVLWYNGRRVLTIGETQK